LVRLVGQQIIPGNIDVKGQPPLLVWQPSVRIGRQEDSRRIDDSIQSTKVQYGPIESLRDTLAV
jgi:hypothetical protein